MSAHTIQFIFTLLLFMPVAYCIYRVTHIMVSQLSPPFGRPYDGLRILLWLAASVTWSLFAVYLVSP